MKKKPQVMRSFAALVAVLICIVSINMQASHASQQAKENMEALTTDVPFHKCTGPKIATDGTCTHTNDRSCSDLNGCDGSDN